MRSVLKYSFLFFTLTLFSFQREKINVIDPEPSVYLVVLGTAQDGGYPQAGCNNICCQNAYSGRSKRRLPTCLGLVDTKKNKIWMIEATPNFPEQWKTLQACVSPNKPFPDGIFLTHAHVGHYAGLIDLGREVMGCKDAPVYMMPKMRNYIRTNGPWSQLVTLNNISIQSLKEDSVVHLNDSLTITPFLVPHRDEFSETVGYIIASSKNKILFIPDIDKWQKWSRNIIEEVKKVDFALIDGTFLQDGELSGRSMKDVPHPFMEETKKLFEKESALTKNKIYFIHFNHTNPINFDGKTKEKLIKDGFNIANEGMKIEL